MATLLLIIIYIAFIGLGTPDSLFGTAWPAIYSEFSLPFSCASIITLIVTCSSMCSPLLSARFIARYGTGKVTTLCTALTVVALTASFRPSLSLGGGYSVLAITFSGVTFPTMAMIGWVQPFTMLFPYTYFMELYIDQAVRGSAWWYSMSKVAAMLLFCLLPLLVLGRLKRVLVNRRYWGKL
jgi:ABC-2 type transport system permease protein